MAVYGYVGLCMAMYGDVVCSHTIILEFRW